MRNGDELKKDESEPLAKRIHIEQRLGENFI